MKSEVVDKVSEMMKDVEGVEDIYAYRRGSIGFAATLDTMRAALGTQPDTLLALGDSMPKSSVMEVGKIGELLELRGTNDEATLDVPLPPPSDDVVTA